jgi:hypothetical protein
VQYDPLAGDGVGPASGRPAIGISACPAGLRGNGEHGLRQWLRRRVPVIREHGDQFFRGCVHRADLACRVKDHYSWHVIDRPRASHRVEQQSAADSSPEMLVDFCHERGILLGEVIPVPFTIEAHVTPAPVIGNQRSPKLVTNSPRREQRTVSRAVLGMPVRGLTEHADWPRATGQLSPLVDVGDFVLVGS